jgi:trimeric autotransporter adhesin
MASFAGLRVALVAGLLVAGGATEGWSQEKVGVNSAVNPDAQGTPPGGVARRLVIGQDVVFNERITTSAAGQTQLLFVDQSAMTVGPNSDLTIDQFVYDPQSGTGKLAMSATRGVLRYVGGKLSKQDNAVTLRTSTATLAVRGGAFIADIQSNGTTEAVFVFGNGLTVSAVNGQTDTIRRPGFQVIVTTGGSSGPIPVSPQQLAQLLAQLDGRQGGTGGASVIPTDTIVGQSGISGTVSGNLGGSIQQALQNQVGGPTNTSPPVNIVNLQTDIVPQPNPICNDPSCTVIVGAEINSQPTPITYAGQLKSTNPALPSAPPAGSGTTTGFVAQTPNGQVPYAGGTLSFPGGSAQSGVFAGSFGSVGAMTFPLVPGSASFGPQGTSSSFGAFSGTSFLSSDNTFFYASITPASQPTQRLFIFGGTPTSSSFYQPTGNTRIFAFTVQPDAALQSTLPFIRSQAGGNLANGIVSPFYIVAPATTAIGDSSTNAAARGMQASLAINGQGANQQSAIAVTAGTIGTQSNGQPGFAGAMRGSSQLSASGPPVRLGSTVGTPVDGNGNSFYGSNSISGFVLDQAGSPAAEVSLSGAATAYGFVQPVLPTPLPNAVGTNRTTQALSGSFGGLMYTTAQSTPYAVSGGSLISTDAATNRVQATLSGNAIPTQAAGVSGLTMQFGGLTGAPGGQAFVDNSNFAALESQTNPQQMVINGTATQPNGQLYLVSSGAAGTPTNLLPAGASYCQCQFLQWGYWGGDLTTANSSNPATPRIDRGGINTWVAGVATPQSNLNSLISQSATASYSGHAIGSVFNNGASYLAAGGFNGTYNFGTQIGQVAVTNFDGHNFVAGGKAPLTGANYSFSGSPAPGFTGTVNGTFFGPNAAETGGNFAVQTTTGPTYIASGIFAGKR